MSTVKLRFIGATPMILGSNQRVENGDEVEVNAALADALVARDDPPKWERLNSPTRAPRRKASRKARRKE